MDVVRSVNGVSIRLADERWDHIISRHEALAGRRAAVLDTVRLPDAVLDGGAGEFLAVRRVERRWIVVAYRELTDSDGFVITAFLSHPDPSKGRTLLWPST